MKHCLIVATALFCNLLHTSVTTADQEVDQNEITASLQRYMLGSSHYRRGDLITISDLEDMQNYLRKTQGNSIYTHPRWRKKALPDHAPLAKYFYGKGRVMLRHAASQLDGYERLGLFARRPKGRKAIETAIAQKTSHGLLELLESSAEPSDKSKQKKSLGRIYTVEEFVQSVSDYKKRLGDSTKQAVGEPNSAVK